MQEPVGYSDFLKRHLYLKNKLLDQGYIKIRLIQWQYIKSRILDKTIGGKQYKTSQADY
jgi:hypothetical protein